MTLYLMAETYLFWPQLLAATAFRILFRSLTLFAMLAVCLLNVNRLSRVTPSTFGVLTVGIRLPFMFTSSSLFTSRVQDVKSVAVDLGSESFRFRQVKKV